MLDPSRDKSEGAHPRGGGRGESAGYVTPDLSYEREGILDGMGKTAVLGTLYGMRARVRNPED